MTQTVQAIYENGLLRPLGELSLAEHETVSLVVSQQSSEFDDLSIDHEFVEWARSEGDPTITLEEVRRGLAHLKGSLAETVIAERGEY